MIIGNKKLCQWFHEDVFFQYRKSTFLFSGCVVSLRNTSHLSIKYLFSANRMLGGISSAASPTGKQDTWGEIGAADHEKGLLPSNLALGRRKACFCGKKTAKSVKNANRISILPCKRNHLLWVRPWSHVILKLRSMGHLGILNHRLDYVAKILFLCRLPKKCHI